MFHLSFRLLRLPLLVVFFCVAASGCATNSVNRAELPEDTIAVQLWENEDARRRRDIIAELQGSSRDQQRRGVLDLNQYSPSGFQADRLDGLDRYPAKLALINPRTRAVTFLDQAPRGARPLSWSKDRTRLMIASDRVKGKFQIFELNLESGEVTLLAPGRGNVLAGSYAVSDGYAFSSINMNDEGQVEMKILRSQTGKPDELLATESAVQHIAYSGSGRHVAYAPRDRKMMSSRSERLPRIVVQEVDPVGNRRELGPGLHPVFSPDGEWIVYSAGRPDVLRTFRMRIDGSGRTPIGPTVRSEGSPAISPDGKYVVYVSKHNGLDRLFVKRFDGTGDTLLFDGAAVEGPIW